MRRAIVLAAPTCALWGAGDFDGDALVLRPGVAAVFRCLGLYEWCRPVTRREYVEEAQR